MVEIRQTDDYGLLSHPLARYVVLMDRFDPASVLAAAQEQAE